MTSAAGDTPATARPERFRHEALLYSGDEDFVQRAGDFIVDAIEADEPILVVVATDKIATLKDAIGEASDLATFMDMSDIGHNPARLIPLWRDFVDQQSSRSSGRLRGLGEPIWADRTADEIVECQRHEALLNVAFYGQPSWWLVCPYDTDSLSPDIIDEAHRTHPIVLTGDTREASATYTGVASAAKQAGGVLPEPECVDEEFVVYLERLDEVRSRVAQRASSLGIDELRVRDLTLAVSEIATNSIRYGGGRARARCWATEDAIYFEVHDQGHIDPALVGRVRPVPGQLRGYGLWLANQVCDLVQIRSFESGSVVRLQMGR